MAANDLLLHAPDVYRRGHAETTNVGTGWVWLVTGTATAKRLGAITHAMDILPCLRTGWALR